MSMLFMGANKATKKMDANSTGRHDMVVTQNTPNALGS
jgi:hypothetical protein